MRFNYSVIVYIILINMIFNLDLELIAKKYDVTTQAIGVVTNDGKLTVNSLIDIDKKQLSNGIICITKVHRN